MAGPSLVDLDGSNFTDIAFDVEFTSTSNWQTGDLVVVVGVTEDQAISLGTPTVTGLTFSLVTSANGANNTRVYIWSATAGSNGSGSITTNLSGNGAAGIAAFVWRGSDGLGNSNTDAGTSAKTVSLTRSAANSGVVLVMGDWNAVNDTAVNADPSGGAVAVAANVSGRYTAFVVYWGDQGAAGTTSYGITDHTGTVDMTMAVVEILGTSAGGGGSVRRLASTLMGVGRF